MWGVYFPMGAFNTAEPGSRSNLSLVYGVSVVSETLEHPSLLSLF